ncbi:hypothetical protein K438DRAFT_1983533 [Mycena galopus ATCC 62051]|nr:hypothetical protein K438DRAFT_1983533 [Mycena galopus ATCC 62051]
MATPPKTTVGIDVQSANEPHEMLGTELVMMRHGANASIVGRKLDRVTQSAKELMAATGKKCLPRQADVVALTIEMYGSIAFIICGMPFPPNIPEFSGTISDIENVTVFLFSDAPSYYGADPPVDVATEQVRTQVVPYPFSVLEPETVKNMITG